jgi:hypothetical protein
MRMRTGLLATCGIFLAAAFVMAQPPERGKGKGGKGAASDNTDLITYMMSFNKKKDGKLTKKELTDKRLHRLFDRADTNKDGVVTRQELEALLAKEAEVFGSPGGPPGKGDRGPKGKPDKKPPQG